MDHISYKNATIPDIGSLITINKRCLPFPYSINEWISVLTDNSYNTIIAQYDKNPAGYIIGKMSYPLQKNPFGHILSVAVLEEFRKRGIANQLIKFIESYTLSKGGSYIHLEVRENNLAAIKFYETNNYQKQGIKKNFYPNGQNAIIMRKTIRD